MFGDGCTEIDIKIAELKGLEPPIRTAPIKDNLLFHDKMVHLLIECLLKN